MKFSNYYERIAREMGCAFLDTSKVIVSSPLDGIHFEAGEHEKLGQAVTVNQRDVRISRKTNQRKLEV